MKDEDRDDDDAEERADVTLFHADPDCDHEIVALWSGIKCSKCSGWYCL